MQSTFLVTLDIGDTSESSLAGYAADIQDSCEADGLPVLSVKPWARQTQAAPSIVVEPSSPTQRLF